MINFDHYLKFSKTFEDILSKLKEDGEIFNTESFGKIEELMKVWLEESDLKTTSDDLRILSTYLLCNVLKPEDYYKEMRFLHEEIRLRNMVPKFSTVAPLMDLIAYTSHYILGDPKKGYTDSNFITQLIDIIKRKELRTENFNEIFANLKAKNYKDPELKKFLSDLESSTKILT